MPVLEYLRERGAPQELKSYLADHYRLEGLHPIDRTYFLEDCHEVIDIALERGEYAGRLSGPRSDIEIVGLVKSLEPEMLERLIILACGEARAQDRGNPARFSTLLRSHLVITPVAPGANIGPGAEPAQYLVEEFTVTEAELSTPIGTPPVRSAALDAALDRMNVNGVAI